jgi:LuxR family transcriptional regulator, quorum-sensing system regulator BjaR1
MLKTSTFEFIEEVERNRDPSSLADVFQKFIRKFGMMYYMVGDPRPPVGLPRKRVWATTWPEEWLLRFGDRNYVGVDPVVRRMHVSNQPFRWAPDDGKSDEEGSHILVEASEYGMASGFAVPIYGRDGLSVIVSIGTQDYEIDRRDEVCLHMAAIYLHKALERHRTQSPSPTRGPKLTPRERECLTWVAAGKTAWEISQILNIAEQTVHEYVRNAMNKLHATTRAQAVAAAIFHKQIRA